MLPRQAAALAKTIPAPSTTTTSSTATGPRRRYKKGPKRVQKRMERVTREQLDKEMEDYRALAIDS